MISEIEKELRRTDIEKKLLQLISQFNIDISECKSDLGSDDSDLIHFRFYVNKSTPLRNMLKFQFFIRKNSHQNLYKINSTRYCSDLYILDISINLANLFYDFLEDPKVHNDLNEIIADPKIDEFLRGFSEDEISAIVRYYPEKARSFMMSEYNELYEENILDNLDESVRFKSYHTPLRYDIWTKLIEAGSWHIYLDELSYGHSEDWAKLVATGKPDKTLDERYVLAFHRLSEIDWGSAMKNLSLNIHRRFANESEIFANKYFDNIVGRSWTKNPLACTQSYMAIYTKCINEGKTPTYADKFAAGMTSGYKAGDLSYWETKAAKQHK